MRQQLKSRKLVWTALLGLFPVLISLILALLKPMLEDQGVELFRLYPQVSFFLYLHFILPILAVFAGSNIVGDEVEDQTMPYLTTRPMPKWHWFTAKLAAQVTVLSLILLVSLLLSYTFLNLNGGLEGWIDESGKLFKSVGVLILGMLAYLNLFALFGAGLKKPVLAGLLFTFGWENLVAYFPGNAKLFTIVHYLHSLFPTFFRAKASGILGMIPIKFTMAGDWTAFLTLIGIAAACLGASVLVLTLKEYRLQRE